MKKLYIIISFSLMVAQDSIGGRPLSLINEITLEAEKVSMPALNINTLIEEDNNRPPATPFRYGYKFDVNYTLDNSGTWTILDNGDRIWSLIIESEGAYAISLEYSQFYLPEESTLYIFSEDRSMVHGGYTNSNNQEDMLFSSPLTKGDVIIIEYYEPFSSYSEGIIEIDYIIHDYRDILNFSNTRDSRSCGDNVVCPSADDYEDQVNATSWLDMGGYICTGAMINNTNFDLTPYYWTAWHCVEGDNPSTFRFYFNYETSSCSGSWASLGSYEYGGTLLSDSGGMDPDYALILINDPNIPNSIYYAGWNKSNSSPTLSAGVHHPNGEPKKINFDNDTAYSSGTINWGEHGSSPAGSHWRVYWDEGGTYGGSSGSPAFNDDGQLIGQLTGGSGDCYEGDTEDYYGKFSRAFSDVSSWLDPIGTGETYIDGTYDGQGGGDPPEVTLTAPTEGESLAAGSNCDIIWSDNFDDNVSLKLYRGGVFASTISASTASDGAFTWTIPADIEPRDDYRIKITNVSLSTVSDFSGYFSIYSSGSVSLNIDAVNLSASGGSIDIYMENDTPVAGYQFTINDAPDYIDIIGLNDLTDSNFSLSSSEDGIIIAFSFTGGTIDEGSGLLLSANFETIESDTITLCLQDPVFSTSSSDPIPVTVGDCVEVELTQTLLGDITLDGEINVLDAVILVNAVLNPDILTDIQFQAADLNADGELNVLDVVSLINIIINS